MDETDRHPLIPGGTARTTFGLLFLAQGLFFFAVGFEVIGRHPVYFLVALVFLVSSLAFFAYYRLFLRRRQDALNAEVPASDGMLARYVLYLRAFSGSGRIRTATFGESWLTKSIIGNRWSIEHALSVAVHPTWRLLAIGDKHRTIGASKITTDDADWQDEFRARAAAAEQIFLLPDVSPSLMWEMRTIQSDPTLAAKTLLVMPPARANPFLTLFGLIPGRTKRYWSRMRRVWAAEGWDLPEYRASGALLRLEGGRMRVVADTLRNVDPVVIHLAITGEGPAQEPGMPWFERWYVYWTFLYPTAARTVVLAFFATLLFRTFVYHPFLITSGSMKPTFVVGDYLFVNKMAYGYSGYSNALHVGRGEGRWFFVPPRRGDVVVFHNARSGVEYVTRIIGLPGETIQMVSGQVVIDNRPVPRERQADFEEVMAGQGPHGLRARCINMPVEMGAPCFKERYREMLDNGHSFDVLDLGDTRLDDTAPIEVPPDHYFVLGDNRDNSVDSRFSQTAGGPGLIPATHLLGRVDRVIFSSEGLSLLSVWAWRWDRFLKRID